MNSLRSRTRLSDSPNTSPNPRIDSDAKAHVSNATALSRLRIRRGLGIALSAAVSLLFITFLLHVLLVQLPTSKKQHHLAKRDQVVLEQPLPKPLHPQSRPSPVPVIYRDFLASLSSNPDKVQNSWPPRVTRIPTTNQKYLLPGNIGEQESKARMHFLDILHLARILGRTLVLPNVGQSRLGMCRDYPFDTYYDTSGLKNVMTMDDFLWLAEDEDRLNAKFVVLGSRAKDQLPKCMPHFDLLPPTIHVDMDNITAVLKDESADVLILNWSQRHPIFPTAMQLPYAPSLVRMADTLVPKEPFVMVHWRMETVPVSALLTCSDALLDAIHSTGITTVWFATDYPLSLRSEEVHVSKSSTFHDFGDAHTQAVNILVRDPTLNVHDVESALGTLKVDTGVLGIMDKLVGIRADVFISGAEGCGRRSSFTQQIATQREAAWGMGQHMLNIVDYFG